MKIKTLISFTVVLIIAFVSIRIFLLFYTVPCSLPTVESSASYVQACEYKLDALNKILAGIQSQQDANEAVYSIASIVAHNTSAFSDLGMEDLAPDETMERLDVMTKEEDVRLSKGIYRQFTNEIDRLRKKRYYQSDALKFILHAYFIEDKTDNPLVLWLPASRFRMAVRDSTLMERIFYTNTQKLQKAMQLKNFIPEESISLLALDALQRAGARCSRYSVDNLSAPPYHYLRGVEALFSNCFCSEYCFNRHPPLSAPPCRVNDWTRCTTGEISRLTMGDLKGNEEYVSGIDVPYDSPVESVVILKLPKAFKSRFIRFYYKNGSHYPTSFIFTETQSVTVGLEVVFEEE